MIEVKHEIKRTINQTLRDKGRFPTEQEMCNILNFSEDQTRKYMEALSEDGYLERIGSWYKFASISEESRRPGRSNILKEKEPESKNSMSTSLKVLDDMIDGTGDYAYETPAPSIKRKVNRSRKGTEVTYYGLAAVPIIRWSMAFIGCSAILISIHYNIKEASRYLSVFFAVIFSAMVVLFSVTAFETIIYVLSRRKIKNWKKFLIVTSFSILWLTSVMVSMTSVVAGRYSRYVENQLNKSKEIAGISSEKFKWDELQKHKSNLQERISEKQKQIQQLQIISSSVKDVESREGHGATFIDSQWRISLVNKDIEKFYKELAGLREKEHLYLEKNPELAATNMSISGIATDFYAWLSLVLKVQKDRIQFFLALFPAFFLDIVAPVAISVALFLKKEN